MTRVAVTTAEDRQDRVAGLMRSVGLVPVRLPCIEIVAADREVLDAARDAAASADAIVLTSSRTVGVLWPEGMPRVPVWAVGSATAGAVRRAGGTVKHVGDAGARSLVAAMPPMPGHTVAFPHADGTDDGVIEGLGGRVGQIVSHAVYRAEPTAPAADAVEAVAFLSPSAVTGWMSVRDLDGIVVGAIGATTAAALVDRGIDVAVVPPTPDLVQLAYGIAAADPVSNRPIASHPDSLPADHGVTE